MEQIIAALVDYGMAGIILAILLFYLNKLTNIPFVVSVRKFQRFASEL